MNPMDEFRTEARRMRAGTATVVADAELTLLCADAIFITVCGLPPASLPQRGDSLRRLLPAALAERLVGFLRSGQTRNGCRVVFGAPPVHVHISAVRIEGMAWDDRYPVYHLVSLDLTGLMEMRGATVLEKKKYAVISDITEDISFEYDFATDTMRYAEKYRRLFDADPVIPRFYERLMDGNSIDPLHEFFRSRLMEMALPADNAPECQIRVGNGGYRWFSLFCTKITDDRGVPVKAVGAIRDIDRQKREQLRLLDRSRIDAMTGLLNKITTEEEIREALGALRSGSLGALMMLDLDNFKEVNDTLGHLAGDDVLAQVARQLRRTFRGEDIIGRVGGDEFHVYMHGVGDAADIEEKAREICSKVRKLFLDSGLDNKLSISVGVACAEGPVAYEELFRQADVALYRAKAGGKNRYAFFGSAVPCEEEQRGISISPLAHRVSRNSIMVDIIDTLFSVSELRRGIDNALKFIGNALRIGAIFIFEKSLDLKTVSITHEWTAEGAWSRKFSCRDIPVEISRLCRPAVPGGIRYCSDVRALSPEERTCLGDPAVTSFLQCDIVREDMLIGCISFEERGHTRIWKQQEIEALVLMSRLIGGYISQKQSAGLLHQSNEATRDILNSLPGTFVCVISKSTHRLLYCNSRIYEQFPHARPGMFCHKVFQHRDTPCVDCLTWHSREEASFSTLLFDSPFGKIARLAVSDILWENREAAYVTLISEHILTKEERELQKKKEAYVHALCNTYEYVLDIDSRTGCYEVLTLAESTRNLFPPQGEYAAALSAIAECRVSSEDRDVFRTRFTLPAMLEAFACGAASLEMEYRWLGDAGEILWKSRFVFPYLLEDGSPHILAYVRDITTQKAAQLRSREEEADYLLALQSNYTEIFHIDMESRRISPLYYDSRQVVIPPEAADIAEFVRLRAANRVAPESLDTVRVFYSPERIRECLDRGKTTEAEYRKRQTEDGDYRWIAAVIRPVPGRARRALLLLRDVTARKEEEAGFYAALKSSYKKIYEIDLDADALRPILHEGDILSLQGLSFSYSRDLRHVTERHVHPEDRARFFDFYAPDNIRRRFAEKDATFCEYRITYGDESYFWFSAVVLPLAEADSCKGLVLCQDVTDRKRMEEERDRESRRFTLALRDTYTEIYELDIDNEISTLIFSNSERLRPVGVGGLAATGDIIATAVHPADRAHVAASFDGRTLRACFEQGTPEVTEEFRRLGKDGNFHWVSAVVVPQREGEALSGKAMLLVKDISRRKAQEQRQRLTEQYFLALRNIYDQLFLCNVTRDTCRVMYQAGNKYAMPSDAGVLSAFIPRAAHDLVHPEDTDRFLAFFDTAAARVYFDGSREYRMEECRVRHADGAFHWAAFTMFPVSAAEGDDEIYLVFIMDIDARKKAEEIAQQNILLERQRFADERYKIIVEQTHTLVFEWCRENDVRYVSPELPRRFAGTYDGRDIMRVWLEDAVIHPADIPVFEEFLGGIGEKTYREMTVRFRRRDKTYIWCKAALTCLRDAEGRFYRYIGTLNDVNEATCSVLALQYRAEYDTLTGICNAQTFYARAAALLREHPERRYFIIRMDIDRFKVVNDLHGLEEGDRLLKTIAALFGERMSAHGVCGRISGDVFCACVDYTREQVLDFVHEMTERLGGYPLSSRIVPSFGICEADNPETPINMLCDWANLALKTVKGNVLVSHAFYDEKLRERILEEKKIESEMHEALSQGQFHLYLQPKVHIPTSRIVGAEGLVRWLHPTQGMIPPDRFIPLFEKNGFVIRLDEYIWEQACKMLRDWLDRGLTPLPIAVNVSRMHIYETRLCEKLCDLVARYRLPPALLGLELTESVFLGSENKLFDAITELQQRGFLFSLDDFGAGYSSLNMLKSLPMDTIKIDRGFLNEVVTTERGKTVIRHTIALARDMDMRIIAEGVENIEQAAFLLDAGCVLAQGFYYSPSITPSAFESLAFGSACPFPVDPRILARTKERQ